MPTTFTAWRSAAQLLCGAAFAAASFVSSAAPELGVYRWDAPNGPAQVDAFSQWLGKSVTFAEAFEASDRWDNVDGAGWQLGPWSQWVRAQHGRNLILSVPLLAGGWDLAGPDGVIGTADDLSLAKCSNGEYDVYWANLANELTWYGLHWAYLRLGWEMDGGWYAWRAQQDQGNELHFAGCFRRVVQVMRKTQPANQWKFVWNPTNNWWHDSYLHKTWPGNEYVDFVGIDLYDQSWAPNTYPYPSPCDDACRLARQQNAWNHYSWHLYTLREFAIVKGKPMAIPEWGITTRADGHGGGENTYYVQKMYEFIMNPANNVAFHVYFDVGAPDGDHRLSPAEGPTRFPQSAELFKKLFGAAPPPPAPAPAPAPAVDTIAPNIALMSPSEGAVVHRRQTIDLEASASDNVGVVAVEFTVNGQLACRRQSAPYRCTWYSGNKREKSYSFTATAIDAAGNRASATRILRNRRARRND